MRTRVLILFTVTALVLMTAPLNGQNAAAATSWVKQNSGTNYGVRGVAALDASHVWAVADEGTILFYDGNQWYHQMCPYSKLMTGVSAVDTNHVWASAGDGVYFFDGNEWTCQYVVGSGLESISAVDTTHVWAISWTGEIYFFDGSSWALQAKPTSNQLQSVYALDSTHVWAVGESGTILFFNGLTWSSKLSPTAYHLFDVSACDANHAWAVGDAGVVCVWNGVNWSASVPGEQGALYSVFALDPDHVWIANGGGEGLSNAVMFWDGVNWNSDLEGIESTMPMFCDIDGLDANSVWIVGTEGTIYGSRAQSATPTYYFAEGCTREGFAEWLCLQNPGADPIQVQASYMLFSGSNQDRTYTVPATSRLSVNVNDEVGPGQDVSVKLWSDHQFYAERPMYFDYKAGQPGFSWTGGHCATGAPSPRKDWYFAEGTTQEGFEEWVCIQNPGDAEAQVTVDYIMSAAYTVRKVYPVGARSRLTVFVNGDVGPNQDVSLHVHAPQPIVAERPIYFNYHGKWDGGHLVMGTDAPKTRWLFAEGTTQSGFEEWLAVQNANNANAGLTVHFLKSDGSEQVNNYTVGANSRWTLDVSQAVGTGVDASIVVESDWPVVVERPMYFDYKEGVPGYGWTGGHDVVGAGQDKTSWFFAEGCTHDWADEYICIANPGTARAEVTLHYMLETGSIVEQKIGIDAHMRATVKVADAVGRGHDVSTELTSDQPVVAERPMYFNYQGWTGGHDVLGF